MRALIYGRVSGDDRRKQDRNLESQRDGGRLYCAEKGYSIVAELLEDDRGASGADLDLPMLSQALEMARAGQFDVLVVRELDRFARSLVKQYIKETEFKKVGVAIEYWQYRIPDTLEGELMKNQLAAFAEYEREKIKQRMVRGRRQVVKAGKVMLHGKPAPYGYRAEDRELVIYEPEAEVIRLVFGWYTDERLSSRKIAERLTQLKVPTWADIHGGYKKRAYGEWSWRQVLNLLDCETYKGQWHYGRRNCKTGEINPREHWLTVEVPSIVSEETFEFAQKQRGRNTTESKRNVKLEYLLRNRLKCGQCGGSVCCYSTSVNGKTYQYYRCSGYMGNLANVECDLPSFRVDHVDYWIWQWLIETLLDRESLERRLRGQQQERTKAARPLQARLTIVDGLLEDNRAQLERLLDLYLSGTYEKADLIARKSQLENLVLGYEAERANLVTALEEQSFDVETLLDMAWSVVKDLEAADEDFERKRAIVEKLDVQVVLSAENDEKIAFVRCTVREESLLIEGTTFQSGVRANSHQRSSGGIRPPVDRTSRHGPSPAGSGTPSATPGGHP